MPSEIAFFTPTQKDGTAEWIDFWNADLYFDRNSDMSGLAQAAQADQVLFRGDYFTWPRSSVGPANGVVHARFNCPSDGYFLFTVLLSATGTYTWAPEAAVELRIDGVPTGDGEYRIADEGVAIPAAVKLTAGDHVLSVIQVHYPNYGGWFPIPAAHLWFHSLTCFEI